MRSVMRHQFSKVPSASIPRSSFDRSHGLKTTFDAGYLVPIYVDEALPGDTFSLSLAAFARLATPLFPFMDNVFMDFFFFAVPNRLVWSNWEKFNGQQTDPGDSTDYLVPTIPSPASTGWAENSLGDYFGIPTGLENIDAAAFHFRAYNLIWNEWFRDQNLQDSVVVDLDDGPDDPADYVLLRRGKRHDYFTSALPWPQKGPAVDIPLGTTAPVLGIGSQTSNVFPQSSQTVHETGGLTTVYANSALTSASSPNSFQIQEDPANPDYPLIYADLTDATAATINDLREAFQIQRMYERDARGGTRYTEVIRSHFGVVSPDARLQRPEYLGGGSVPLQVNPVAQTSGSDITGQATPQGNLSAFATATARGVGFAKSFTEHCVLVGLVSVRADLNYQQGLNRMWSRQTRFDYYWPSLAHLGEQAVLNQEIYAQGTAADLDVFGYQERYAEYRYKPSSITGEFRSQAAASLDVWHLAQDFSALPVLNASFIEDNPPLDRVVATPDEPHFLFDSYVQLRCARPMPVYSVPGLIDHF